MREPILTERLITRGYELGSDGRLPPSAFLRYLEHQRWQSLTDEGPIPVRRLWGLGVIRGQALQILEDVSFHVEIETSMWVSRVGTRSMDFSHAVTRVRDGKVVARSTATVVPLDASRRPLEVPAEARSFVLDRPGARVERPTGARDGAVWERELPLRPSDQDMQQHVNHARYADLVADTVLLCAQSKGYGAGDFERPIRSLSLSYDRELRASERATARTYRVPGKDRSVEVEIALETGEITTRARVELG